VEYPDLFHEIFNEASHAHILRDTTQWLDAHVKA
jgi:alpha-beta hydrolase superfamily lysophospholipase